MKKFILGFILLAGVLSVNAQSERYMAAMKKNLAAVDSSATAQSMLSLSDNFERIGNAEKSQWLPFYYAALMQVRYGFMQGDMSGADPIADRAEKLLNKADSIQPKNSEISCVKAMIATLRMIVNPMQRYMEQGTLIEQNLDAAKEQDATNPRPYYLKGENLKNTPAQFGGGCDAAKTVLNTAKEKFASFRPASEIAPNWGASRVDMLLNECK
ncbi:hypothetical protein [Ferruginibacter sp. HRS2-29]|uniref:hypothetical protein n=1 Tax=Ferruginibacter sp. HRS2-29 TaxID=2487334 RepID=UPI0020CCBF8C|nr:hypothetical protein [Ferruginibacter sp. HRS2-29]MCP9751292.1 hypothetical protein [Ferruginibacter sp. HRS2-29]